MSSSESGSESGSGSEGSGSSPVPLHPTVMKRVEALVKIQDEYTEVHDQYVLELRALEKKYDELYQAVYAKRRDVVAGVADVEGAPAAEEPKGVPGFWLQAFQNHRAVASFIEPHDIPVLEHLTDVTCTFVGDLEGFKLSFYFSPNPFFEDEVLTKTLIIPDIVERTAAARKAEEGEDEEDEDGEGPFEGIKKIEGCDIHWKAGKNVTVRVVRKKGKKGKKPVTKEEDLPSFFRFFETPDLEMPEGVNRSEAMEHFQAVQGELECAESIREIVSDAVHWFTGEAAADEDEEDEYEEGDEEDEEEEEEEEESEEEEAPKKGKGGKGKGGKGEPSAEDLLKAFSSAKVDSGDKGGDAGDKPECKQQ